MLLLQLYEKALCPPVLRSFPSTEDARLLFDLPESQHEVRP